MTYKGIRVDPDTYWAFEEYRRGLERVRYEQSGRAIRVTATAALRALIELDDARRAREHARPKPQRL